MAAHNATSSSECLFFAATVYMYSNIYYKQAWSFTMVHNTKNSEHKLQALSIVEAPTFRECTPECELQRKRGWRFIGCHFCKFQSLAESCELAIAVE
ncbi:uncharacterized protein LOC131166141 isoform X3 [Malania oleifera]|uniref:uncharacterized protein LOC131166141 isoform X3 n=1 Tax=Malania oleifera TaxID=397392 RepID=UPI0025AE0F1F|nr:uncharacterized protein LOC131166141 isoform X3 [Malania oleifera]XP_057980457.1 uncharacterized protein LOC131166141 isoform X3 [Malania oleifera]